jgi:hypothetical protein
MFNTPFISQSGVQSPNAAGGVITQTPTTPCPYAGGPAGCVDWSSFRSLLLFGEFQPHLRTQYAEQYNLTVERQLTSDMLLRVAYVGTQAHHLLASHDLNYGNTQTCLDLITYSQPCSTVSSDLQYQFTLPAGAVFHMPYIPNPAGGPNIPCPYANPHNPAGCVITGAPGGTPIDLVGIRPYSSPNCNPIGPNIGVGCPADGVPIFSNIFAEDTIANSNYNGLQISVEKNYSHGLLFQASYTFSKAIDQGASFENELNPINQRQTRGVSLLDAKNRFVFSPVWELPIPKKEGVTGKLVNGWQVSAIITYQSGFPILINNCNDTELEGSTLGFECPGKPSFATATFKTHDPRRDGFVFDPNQITNNVPLGTFGNVPRTLCCNPPINNWDFGLYKQTPVGERLRVEFRSEFYNIFNHAQFYGVDGNSGNQGSTFGQPQKVRDPRLLQFALKFVF